MIATLWGKFAWHKFRGTRAKSKVDLGAVVGRYLPALALIALSYKAG